MPDEKPQKKQPDFRKWRKRAMILGALLALVCQMLPPDYHAVCKAVAKVCTAGF